MKVMELEKRYGLNQYTFYLIQLIKPTEKRNKNSIAHLIFKEFKVQA